MPPRNDAEHRLQRALIQHLRLAELRNVFWFAVPNGGHRSIRTAARLKAEGVQAGVPDLVVIVMGIAHGLELKVKGNRQTPAQRLVEDAWKAAGGAYAVATGLDEALERLRTWGALPADYAFVPARRRQLPLQFEDAA